MLNPGVRERLSQVELLGADLVSIYDELADVATRAGAPDAIMLLNYASKDDNLQAGEFVAEIHLVVKRVPEQEQ
jgi:hypothetical protein